MHFGRVENVRTLRRGLTLIEVMLAAAILVISAASILTAFVAGTSISEGSATLQQATMLASNLMEEIKALPNYENGDYNQDDLKSGVPGCDGGSPYREVVPCGDDPAPVGGARTTFDDKTDYDGYQDGVGVAAAGGIFRDFAGDPISLFTDGQPLPEMYREVTVFDNGGGAFVEVHVTVYLGTAGSSIAELCHLVRLY